MMQDRDDGHLLDELASRLGIDSHYYDIFGTQHVVSQTTKQAILAAMGVQALTRDQLVRALTDHQEEARQQPCDPVAVYRLGEECNWLFRMPVEEGESRTLSIEWSICDEAGAHLFSEKSCPNLDAADRYMCDGHPYWTFKLPVPRSLGIGYYDLAAIGRSTSHEVCGSLRLIIVPTRCYNLPALEAGRRLWGLSLQLYELQSSQNWGVGDFGDLLQWVDWAAKDLGADIIGLNPLHALKNTRPYHISPYSPDSRFSLNVLYIDVQAIPEFLESTDAQQAVEDDEFRVCVEALRKSDRVEYEHVAAAKRKILELVFATFEARHFRPEDNGFVPCTQRGEAFERYLQDQGDGLESFALFQSLAETFAQQTPPLLVWQEWPEPYRHVGSPVCAEFLVSHRYLIRFHQYLQWVTHQQLQRVYDRTRVLGMPIGLYHDLALGSDRGGSDAWIFQSVLALGADCGCPPDAFAPEGQNWGLPPINPHALRRTGYRMFIELLRSNLKHGGAIRLDHVMALFRLFWIPRGLPPSAGAYVQYPWEDLLGILALESVRHRAVIVGEDLGTVPDFVREKLGAAGILSYRVFYFERGHDGEWKPPDQYPQHALAVVATHDLPTLAGFWTGEDLAVRDRLGFYQDEEAYRQAREARHRDKAAVLRALQREGIWSSSKLEADVLSQPLSRKLTEAIHAFVARAPSSLMLVTLEDLIGDATQINLPGTLDSYPNWSHKVPLMLENVQRHDSAIRLTRMLRTIRP